MTNSGRAAAVEVRELSRRYGGRDGFEAVRDVSFRVERGELFALLGTNGAGKTSTMELVEGLDRPGAGSVRVLGHDPYTQRAAVRPRLGVMLQQGGFPPDLTAAETAAMWAGTLTAPRPVAEALAMVELDHRATVRVKQLSGGERRRLDLALALLGRPEVLLLDEPTTGLDPESRHNTWRLLRNLLLDGATILLTTHYLEEAQELADRLAIMRRGRIVAARHRTGRAGRQAGVAGGGVPGDRDFGGTGMSVTTVPPGVRRIRSIGRAELRLFWRNRMAMFNTLGAPVAVTGVVAGSGIDGGALSTNAFVVTALLGFVLLAAVYYNLVTTYVARREELVLKRLRAGPAGREQPLTERPAPGTA